jgi:hypothetical protein
MLDAVHSLRWARQQLSGFLLRQGCHYGRPAWTKLTRSHLPAKLDAMRAKAGGRAARGERHSPASPKGNATARALRLE